MTIALRTDTLPLPILRTTLLTDTILTVIALSGPRSTAGIYEDLRALGYNGSREAGAAIVGQLHRRGLICVAQRKPYRWELAATAPAWAWLLRNAHEREGGDQ
jgi:hypothetical protein